MYRVTEYLGDYPLESQLHWNAEFLLFIRAYHVAKGIWEESVRTTKVLDPDYYVLIEKESDANWKDAGWAPIGAFNIAGSKPYDYINARNVRKFIRRFEMGD